MNIEKLKRELIRDEGSRSTVYDCPAGKRTIGVGRNLEDNGLSEDEISMLLENDIENCRKQLLEHVPVFEFMNDSRQRVLLNMCFNMGIAGLKKFKRMFAALAGKDFSAASREMMDSRWAEQVGKRADRLSKMMREGE